MRIRQIKPEFWDDEDLAEVSRDARLLFIGLWNEADSEGKIKGTAKYIKGKLFRYDDDLDCSKVESLLNELFLHEKKFIVRYEFENCQYIFLPRFTKHQKLDPREKAKGYPDANEGQKTLFKQCVTSVQTPTEQHGYMDTWSNGSLGSGKLGGGSRESDRTLPPPQLLTKFQPVMILANETTGDSISEEDWIFRGVLGHLKGKGSRVNVLSQDLSEFCALNPDGKKLVYSWLSHPPWERMAAAAYAHSKPGVVNEIVYALQAIEKGWEGYRKLLPVAEQAAKQQDYRVEV